MASIALGRACARTSVLSVAVGLALALPAQAHGAGTGGGEPAGQRGRAVELDRISVTAAGYEQNIKDAPATISVISAEEIKARSYTDITDVLKNVPGIHVQGGGVEQSIMIRGMGADYTLFLVDGKPMQDNQAFGLNGAQAGTPINFLPPLEAIERIEVIRGPASSLYGSSAMGGVVNVITRKVRNDFGGSLSAEYVKSGPGNDLTNDGFSSSVALNMPLLEDVMSLQVTGAFHDQEESDFVGGGDSAASDPDYRRRSAGAKLAWKLDEANTFTVGGDHAEQERTHTPGRSVAADDDYSYSRSLRDSFYLTHEGRHESVTWSSYVTYESSENPTRVNADTGNGIEFNAWNANSQATWFLGDSHTLVAGGSYRREELQDGATNGLDLPGIAVPTDVISMKRYQSSLFVEDNWQLTADLALLFGGRYDDNEKFGGNFSPKVYAVYGLTDTLTLKGGMTTGYKAPSLRQSATDFGSTSMGGVIIGNPDLKPETSTNYEIGLNYEDASGVVSGSLTAYRTSFEDKLMRTGRICAQNAECVWGGITYPAHRFGYTTTQNIDSARLRGLEFTLDWRILDNLVYRHSYTFAESEQTSGTYKGSPLNDIPEHMFNASLDWKVSRRVRLWTQANYRGETSGRAVAASGSQSNGVTYAPYTFFDLGMVYSPSRKMRLKLGVYNAGNKQVTPEEGFAYVLDGRRISAAMSLDF